MSRTYRRNDRVNRYRGEKMRRGRKPFQTSENVALYRNAMRIQCSASLTEKWLFHSEEAALQAISYNKKERIRRDKPDKYERTYFCKACGGYHLTSKPKEVWLRNKYEMGVKQGRIQTRDYANFSTNGGFSAFLKQKEDYIKKKSHEDF